MGLRVLSLDGGGVLGYSELLILADIMEEISQESKPGNLRPYDYFDVITGAGIGGVIALLLGRLRLTVTQCLLEYRTISTCILRDSMWGPLYDKEKVQNVANSIVKKYCHNNYNNDSASLLEDDTQISGKTFVFAVKSDGKVYCFRTYHPHIGQGNVSISISDAIVALLSAKGQLDEVTFKTFDGCTTFSDAPYPCGLRNPILHVLGEIHGHWQNSINLIVSIGTGRVPETDIPDLLKLEKLHELSPSIGGLFQPWKWPATLINLMTTTQEPPEKIVQQLERNEQDIETKLLNMGHKNAYNRFEIGPVKDTGPNDFRSVMEIIDETKNFLNQHQTRVTLASVANQLRTAGPGKW